MSLYQALGYHLPPEVFYPLKDSTAVVEYECAVCRFRFFDPLLAGSGGFYEALGNSDYYVRDRPEFQFALKQFGYRSSIRRVIDVGGGDGAFLDLAAKHSLETYGAELNEVAAQQARSKGHVMFSKPLGQIATSDLNGAVDAITMFHVLEHVPEPLAFVQQATALLRSGGLLVIAVPNEVGLFRIHPYDPKNLPPHHVSRWRPQDLNNLAERCGLQLVEMSGDPLYGTTLREFWRQHNRLAAAIKRPPRVGGDWLADWACFLYRKLGIRHFLPRWGLSTYGLFEKK